MPLHPRGFAAHTLVLSVCYLPSTCRTLSTHSSGSTTTSENTKAIKEIQEKLKEIVPSLNDSINLTTIKDLESRLSSLEEKVDQIIKFLESRKIK